MILPELYFQNLKSTIKGGVAGFIIEFFARSIAKGVSDSLPFYEGDTIFGKLGIDKSGENGKT